MKHLNFIMHSKLMEAFHILLALILISLPSTITALSFRLEFNKPFCFIEDRPSESVSPLFLYSV